MALPWDRLSLDSLDRAFHCISLPFQSKLRHAREPDTLEEAGPALIHREMTVIWYAWSKSLPDRYIEDIEANAGSRQTIRETKILLFSLKSVKRHFHATAVLADVPIGKTCMAQVQVENRILERDLPRI